MNTYVDDSNSVGETDTVIFTSTQASPVSGSVTLVNSGSNTLNYRFQAFASVSGAANTWVDMDVPGNPLNNSLVAGAVTQPITVSSVWSQVRLVANASGGSLLNFSLARYFLRPDGGNLPLLSY